MLKLNPKLSKEIIMTICDAKTAATEVKSTAEIVEELKATEVVEQVINGSKVKDLKVKAAAKRDWISIVGAGAIAAVGNAANMAVSNILNVDVHGEDASQYSALEIIGVSVATGTVATGIRYGLDFIPQVNRDETIGMLTTSLVSNTTFVAAALVRDSALALIRGKLASVDVVEMSEEALA